MAKKKLYTMKLINESDDILLYLDERRKYLIRVELDKEFHTHKGFVKVYDLIGKPFGCSIFSSLGIEFYALRPLIRDRILKIKRLTQVLYPKDIGYILFQTGVGAGSRVVEAGTGSGALTCAIADSVRPNGIVYSYEINPKFQKIACKNIERAGLMRYVKLKEGDVTKGIDEREIDAVLLDMATPWLVVPYAYNALNGGGVLVSFSPTIEQVKKTIAAINMQKFVDVETVELILRKINVEENKTRPKTLMIGHSGYISTARKVVNRARSE